MKNKFILTLLFTGLVAGSACAESLTLTTYYPAPFGAYDRLRLVPRAALSGSCDIGTLYVLTPDQIRFCQDDGSGNGIWGPLVGVWTQNGNNIYPTDTAGNPNLRVGVGTTTPGATLDISGSIPNIYLSDTDITGPHEIRSANSGFLIRADANNNDGGSHIRFDVDGSEKARIDANGNLGIGINSPQSRLDLGNADGDIRIYDGNGTPHVLGDQASGESDGIILRALGNPANGAPIFAVESTGYAQRLRVEHLGALKTANYLEVDGTGDSYILGELGVGTTNPTNTLHVNGGITLKADGTNTGPLMVDYQSGGYYATYAP